MWRTILVHLIQPHSSEVHAVYLKQPLHLQQRMQEMTPPIEIIKLEGVRPFVEKLALKATHSRTDTIIHAHTSCVVMESM